MIKTKEQFDIGYETAINDFDKIISDTFGAYQIRYGINDDAIIKILLELKKSINAMRKK